jgi:hypothetical protein
MVHPEQCLSKSIYLSLLNGDYCLNYNPQQLVHYLYFYLPRFDRLFSDIPGSIKGTLLWMNCP